MGRIGKRLTQKQRIFIAEYGRNLNATKSALAAGYSRNRPDRAGEIGYQLLPKTPIKDALQRTMEERLRRIGVHALRTLEEVARVGFSDIRKLLNDDGSLKLPKDWDPETAAAVAGLVILEKLSDRGNGREIIGRTRKVRMFDKVKALELLMKYLRLLPTGDQKVGVEVHVREFNPAPLPNPELSPKIVSLVKLAAQRKKEAEQVQLGGERCNSVPK